jgi:hypothetical protein
MKLAHGLALGAAETWDRPLRALIAIVGGWLASNWFVGWFALLAIVVFGVQRDGATIMASLLGFPVYMAILIWAFAVRDFRQLATRMAILCVANYLLLRVLVPFGPLYAPVGG